MEALHVDENTSKISQTRKLQEFLRSKYGLLFLTLGGVLTWYSFSSFIGFSISLFLVLLPNRKAFIRLFRAFLNVGYIFCMSLVAAILKPCLPDVSNYFNQIATHAKAKRIGLEAPLYQVASRDVSTKVEDDIILYSTLYTPKTNEVSSFPSVLIRTPYGRGKLFTLR